MSSASTFDESAFRETGPAVRAPLTMAASELHDEEVWNRSVLSTPAFWVAGVCCMSFWSLLYVLIRSV
jgi:hypothetical protein